MAIPNYRAFSLSEYPIQDLTSLRLTIIRTEWNAEIVDVLTESCLQSLASIGFLPDQIAVELVPGSYELPIGAKFALNSPDKPDAIICLGCVIQGETKHDDYINHSIARSIAQLSLVSNTPVIFGVLTVNNIEQARSRAGGAHGNKGEECAIAAIKMISLKQKLAGGKKRISFGDQ